MQPSRLNEVIRWLCVLPAAMLGEFAAQFLLRGLFQIAEFGGWDLRSGGLWSFWFGVIVFHLPRKSAFVVAGALMAPRWRVGAACGLLLLGIGLSLMIHVVGQYLAGNRVGLVNYAHFAAEAIGFVAGAAFIVRYSRQTRRTASANRTPG